MDEKRAMMNVMAHFSMTHCMGLPLPGSPLMFPPPPFLPQATTSCPSPPRFALLCHIVSPCFHCSCLCTIPPLCSSCFFYGHHRIASHRHGFMVLFYPGGGVRGVGMMASENEPRQMLWLRFRNSPSGPPTSLVPPHPSPSPVPPLSDSKPPTSLWKGEGQVQQHPHF